MKAVIAFTLIGLIGIYLIYRELIYHLEKRYLERAEKLLANEDYEAVITHFAKRRPLSISLNGKVRQCRIRGTAYYYLKRFKSCVQDFERALSFNPDNELLYRQCGMVYFRWENYKRAVDYFEQAIKIKDDEMESYYLRGLAYEQLLKRDEALQDFSKAYELQKEDDRALYRRASLYHQMGRHTKAYDDLKLLLWRSPYNTDYLSKMATVQYHLGMFKEAEKNFSNALKKEPHSSSINYNMARYHYLMGHFDTARSFIDKALELGETEDKYLLLKALIVTNKSDLPSDDSCVNTELLEKLKSSTSISKYDLAVFLILIEDYQGAFKLISLERVEPFNELYKYIYYYIIAKLAAQTGKEREALKLIENEISSEKLLSWPYSAAEYLIGNLDRDELNYLVDSDPLKQCEANFYIAMKLIGEAPACEIKEALEKVIESEAIDNYEYQMARYFLNNFELISKR